MLSQRFGKKSKLHPMAFFLKKLSTAKCNYDTGNRELLALKLPMQEWHQWLEGASHLSTIFTDHKNLEFIKSAKRLNFSQTHWALFFARFQFTISNRPGSRNTKSDSPVSIQPLPEKPAFTCFVGAITWDTDQEIEHTPEVRVQKKQRNMCLPTSEINRSHGFTPPKLLDTLALKEPTNSFRANNGGPVGSKTSTSSSHQAPHVPKPEYPEPCPGAYIFLQP